MVPHAFGLTPDFGLFPSGYRVTPFLTVTDITKKPEVGRSGYRLRPTRGDTTFPKDTGITTSCHTTHPIDF